MSGLIRATLPSARVARPSLKLTLDQSTRTSTSPGGRSASANSRTPALDRGHAVAVDLLGDVGTERRRGWRSWRKRTSRAARRAPALQFGRERLTRDGCGRARSRRMRCTPFVRTCVCAGGPAGRWGLRSRARHDEVGAGPKTGPGAATPLTEPRSFCLSRRSQTDQEAPEPTHGRTRSDHLPPGDPGPPRRPEARPDDQRPRRPDLRHHELRVRRRRPRRAPVRAPGVREHLHPDHEPDDRRVRAAGRRARGRRRGPRPRLRPGRRDAVDPQPRPRRRQHRLARRRSTAAPTTCSPTRCPRSASRRRSSTAPIRRPSGGRSTRRPRRSSSR